MRKREIVELRHAPVPLFLQACRLTRPLGQHWFIPHILGEGPLPSVTMLVHTLGVGVWF